MDGKETEESWQDVQYGVSTQLEPRTASFIWGSIKGTNDTSGLSPDGRVHMAVSYQEIDTLFDSVIKFGIKNHVLCESLLKLNTAFVSAGGKDNTEKKEIIQYSLRRN